MRNMSATSPNRANGASARLGQREPPARPPPRRPPLPPRLARPRRARLRSSSHEHHRLTTASVDPARPPHGSPSRRSARPPAPSPPRRAQPPSASRHVEPASRLALPPSSSTSSTPPPAMPPNPGKPSMRCVPLPPPPPPPLSSPALLSPPEPLSAHLARTPGSPSRSRGLWALLNSAADPPCPPCSELKLRRLTEHNQRLREDLERQRVRVSEASARSVLTSSPSCLCPSTRARSLTPWPCSHPPPSASLPRPARPRPRPRLLTNSLIRYCKTTRDYLVPSVWGPVQKGEDPYAPQASGGVRPRPSSPSRCRPSRSHRLTLSLPPPAVLQRPVTTRPPPRRRDGPARRALLRLAYPGSPSAPRSVPLSPIPTLRLLRHRRRLPALHLLFLSSALDTPCAFAFTSAGARASLSLADLSPSSASTLPTDPDSASATSTSSVALLVPPRRRRRRRRRRSPAPPNLAQLSARLALSPYPRSLRPLPILLSLFRSCSSTWPFGRSLLRWLGSERDGSRGERKVAVARGSGWPSSR